MSRTQREMLRYVPIYAVLLLRRASVLCEPANLRQILETMRWAEVCSQILRATDVGDYRCFIRSVAEHKKAARRKKAHENGERASERGSSRAARNKSGRLFDEVYKTFSATFLGAFHSATARTVANSLLPVSSQERLHCVDNIAQRNGGGNESEGSGCESDRDDDESIDGEREKVDAGLESVEGNGRDEAAALIAEDRPSPASSRKERERDSLGYYADDQFRHGAHGNGSSSGDGRHGFDINMSHDGVDDIGDDDDDDDDDIDALVGLSTTAESAVPQGSGKGSAIVACEGRRLHGTAPLDGGRAAELGGDHEASWDDSEHSSSGNYAGRQTCKGGMIRRRVTEIDRTSTDGYERCDDLAVCMGLFRGEDVQTHMVGVQKVGGGSYAGGDSGAAASGSGNGNGRGGVDRENRDDGFEEGPLCVEDGHIKERQTLSSKATFSLMRKHEKTGNHILPAAGPQRLFISQSRSHIPSRHNFDPFIPVVRERATFSFFDRPLVMETLSTMTHAFDCLQPAVTAAGGSPRARKDGNPPLCGHKMLRDATALVTLMRRNAAPQLCVRILACALASASAYTLFSGRKTYDDGGSESGSGKGANTRGKRKRVRGRDIVLDKGTSRET